MYRLRYFSSTGGMLGTVMVDSVPPLYSQTPYGEVVWLTLVVYGEELLYEVVVEANHGGASSSSYSLPH
jgi:hypothetical protein